VGGGLHHTLIQNIQILSNLKIFSDFQILRESRVVIVATNNAWKHNANKASNIT
jgi:hypothetical protein